MNQIIQFIQEHPYLTIVTVLAIYERLSRFIPTEGNWSILHNLMAVLASIAATMDKYFPNKTEQPAVVFEVTKVEKVTPPAEEVVS